MADANSFPFITNKVKLTPRSPEFANGGFDFTVQPIEVDATLTEQHKVTIAVARHPVSRGLAIVDNVRPEPDTLTLVCLFSQTPTRIDDAIKRAVSGYAPETTLADIKSKAKEGYVWTVETTLETYDNMVVESLDTPRDVGLANVVQVTIVFSERRLASETYTTVETRKPTTGFENAKKTTSKGQQPTKPLETRTAGTQAFEGIVDTVKSVFGN